MRPSLHRLLGHLARAVVILSLWAGASAVFGARWLPSPWTTAIEFVRSLAANPMLSAQGVGDGGVLPHVGRTAATFISGLIAGSTLAYLAALQAQQSRRFEQVLSGLILPWRIVPPIVFVPLVIALSGSSPGAHVLAVAAYAFVSFLPYSNDALAATPQALIDLARVQGAGSWWTLRQVRIPFTLPRLLGPLKLVAAFSLGITVIVEFLAAPAGLGRVMKVALSYTAVNLIVVSIIWVLIVGWIADLAIHRALARATTWTRNP